MAGVPLPAPPRLNLPDIKDPEARKALAAIQVYLDALRRQIERDYSVTAQDEGTEIARQSILNFVGAGVTVTLVGSVITVTIP
jgi:hypothetical protein